MTTKQTPVHLVRALIVIDRGRKRKASRTGFNLVLRVIGLLILFSMLGLVLIFGMGIGGSAGAYTMITENLPSPEDVEATFNNNETFETTKIFDRTGEHLLYEVIDPNAGDRNWVAIGDVPPDLINATIAMEDKSFWSNPGFDIIGLTRAFWNNLQGKRIQGASTITQQVVKNSVIPLEERAEKSYARKIKETLIAIELTRRYEKETILEWYLNTNFYGNLAYGVDAAARVYFDKSVSDLTLSEAATIVAIHQSPGLNPLDNPELALHRRDISLNRMVEEGYITTEEANIAKAEEWELPDSEQRFDIQAPHFSMYVRRLLEERYGPEMVAGGGLRVYTTLDLDLNLQSECVIQSYLRILSGEDPATVIAEELALGCEAAQYLPDVPARRIGNDYNVKNSAVVVMRANTGEILSMIGSADYWNPEIAGEFNVAADGLRQPGSSFKPFTYVTFLDQGHNAAHMFLDVRQAFSQGDGSAPYVPENYSRNYHGPVSLRSSLARSLNIPAVEAMAIAGIDNVLRTAHKMGITTLDKSLQHYGLSLTLGGGEVKLIDMVYAFSVFANNGTMYGEPITEAEARPGFRELNPVAILRVEDRNGQILEQYEQADARQVLDEKQAFLITDILSDRYARLPAFGTPNALELANERPAAAKTGTTNDFTDNWTVGYTADYVAGVWMGNKDPYDYMINTPGSYGAAFIWHAVMEYANKDDPITAFTEPEGLEVFAVCSVSGLKLNEHCAAKYEIMVPGTEPTEVDNLHQVFPINRETGKLATIHTPLELVEHKVYIILPPEAQDWIDSLAEDRRAVYVPPSEYDTINGSGQSQAEVAIVSPLAYANVGGVVPVMGNARGNLAFYRLVFGRGVNPGEWMQIGPDHGNQVDNNLLENFDTTGLDDGLYTLQLQVVGHDQQVRQTAVQLTVDNQPPKVDLTYPIEGSEYEYGLAEWVNINAEVNDNYAVAKVEFYKNNEAEPFNVRTVAPFNINWTLGGPGQYSFHVIVYDAAGNKTQTAPVSIYVVAKSEP